MTFCGPPSISPFTCVDPFRADRIRNEVSVEDIDEDESSPVEREKENEEDGWSDVSV